MKEGFVLRKGKVYPLSREEREEVHEFTQEQLRKGYIRPSKSSQIAPVFFVGKKDSNVRRGLYWGGSPQNGLGDEWTCKTTLASAYMLHCLSAAWSQLQMLGRSPRWE